MGRGSGPGLRGVWPLWDGALLPDWSCRGRPRPPALDGVRGTRPQCAVLSLTFWLHFVPRLRAHRGEGQSGGGPGHPQTERPWGTVRGLWRVLSPLSWLKGSLSSHCTGRYILLSTLTSGPLFPCSARARLRASAACPRGPLGPSPPCLLLLAHSSQTPSCSPADPAPNLPGKPKTSCRRQERPGTPSTRVCPHLPEAIGMTRLEGWDPGVRRAGAVEAGAPTGTKPRCLQARQAVWVRTAILAIPDEGREMVRDDSLGASGRTAPACLMVFRRKILITCEIEDLFSDSAPRSDSAKQAGMLSSPSVPGWWERPPRSRRPLPVTDRSSPAHRAENMASNRAGTPQNFRAGSRAHAPGPGA